MLGKLSNTLNLLLSKLNLWNPLNKLLILHTIKKKKKKLRIALLFSWIAFISIMFSLNLIKKVTDF